MSTSQSGSKPSCGWQPPSVEEMQAMLPQYRFEKLLGRGGMGAVYQAVQASLDRPVEGRSKATLTPQGFSQAFSRLRNLKSLQFNGEKITDDWLPHIAPI
jgi:serine/threonine protein kinase